MASKLHPHERRPSLETLLAELRRRGHRITTARTAILKLLHESETPLSAAEILSNASIRKASSVKTTIYRELEFLMDEHFARAVDIKEGKRHFELLVENDHHHHLICTHCDSVTCVELPHHLIEIEEGIEKALGFTIERHILEFFGICSDCQRKSRAQQGKKGAHKHERGKHGRCCSC